MKTFDLSDKSELIEKYLVVDFEIYWCTFTGYELGKMSVEQYCRARRFEILLACAVAFNGKATTIALPPEGEPKPLAYWKQKLTEILADYDGVICHNAYVDGFILGDVLKIPIKKLICTNILARWHGCSRLGGVSLANQSKTLGIYKKGDFIVQSNGRRWPEFNQTERESFIKYCLQDCYLTLELAKRLTLALTHS
ncbi:MAG: hypothetical protein LBV23_01430 [Deltaproteobacteria bacterium]|jgi:hypothetical protein|nr:hypothetical protein [Deltaproteobacteria bacterium]